MLTTSQIKTSGTRTGILIALLSIAAVSCAPPEESSNSAQSNPNIETEAELQQETTSSPGESEKELSDIAVWNGANFDKEISSGTMPAEDGVSANVAGDFSSASSGGRTSGAIFRMNSEQETAASKQEVVVSITAKGGPYAIAYSTNEVGNSGWQEVEGSGSWNTYSFTYKVPGLVNGGGDFVGVVARDPEVPVEVRRVTVSTHE